MRCSLRIFAVLAILSTLLMGDNPIANAADTPDVKGRPNIVLIMSDDMGWSDLGCYGGEAMTPNLDALAAGGVRFTQFYNTGRCCPTRASLMTGLYPHQAGVGHMMQDKKLPGYRGNLHRHTPTIAENLHLAGYSTAMAGKWHVTLHTNPDGPKFDWPRQRGFDQFYGTITGAGSFFDPSTLCRDNTFITPANDQEYQPDEYYYTDAISDNAVKFLQNQHQQSPEKPFFLYVAYTAAHWPMHALPEDIAKYKGKFDTGYGPIRQARVERLKKLGLLPPDWDVTPMVGDWEAQENKIWEARCMEVYAAMIDRMDQGIGRIISELKQEQRLDNTLILFLQDNGGCAETLGRTPKKQITSDLKLKPLAADFLQAQMLPDQTRDGRAVLTGPQVMPGPATSYIAYGRNWANVSNTPFREYKHWVHEGGISTPLIAHWPQGIAPAQQNQFVHDPAHLIDIMATCVDLAGAQHPAEFAGEATVPLEGVSLRPALTGKSLQRSNPIFWEHEGNRAVRQGKWKLVAKGATGPWELYDMEVDRTEMHDLSQKQIEKAEELAALWDSWAERAHAKPWPWGGKKK